MRIRTILAVATGSSLMLLYMQLVWFYVNYEVFLPVNLFESGMILLQASKMVAVLAVGQLRRAKFALIFDIFAAEILIIPVILLFLVATGNQVFAGLATAIFLAWPVSVVLILTPFAVYRAGRAIISDAPPSGVLPGTMLLIGLLLLFSEVAQSHSAGFVGTSGFMSALFLVLLQQPVGFRFLPTGILGSAVLPVIYVCMLLYAVVKVERAQQHMNVLLLISTLASLLVLGWAVLLSYLAAEVLLFSLPTLALAAVAWWSGREG